MLYPRKAYDNIQKRCWTKVSQGDMLYSLENVHKKEENFAAIFDEVWRDSDSKATKSE